jgi:hypothetical protein
MANLMYGILVVALQTLGMVGALTLTFLVIAGFASVYKDLTR